VRTETVGEDAYAALATAPGAHELELKLVFVAKPRIGRDEN
jgi:hypothetical protein